MHVFHRPEITKPPQAKVSLLRFVKVSFGQWTQYKRQAVPPEGQKLLKFETYRSFLCASFFLFGSSF